MARISFLLALFLCAAVSPAAAQELNATVTMDLSRISGTSYDYLEDMESQVESYLNETDWISADFEPRERIEVSMQITVMEAGENHNFTASLVIRSQRPIYNSLQNTTLLLYNDREWSFNYPPNRALVHDELQFDPLTTLLDYYAYLVLGLDFDSFEELGGTPYYAEARNLVSLARTVSSSGWDSGSSRESRTALAEQLQDPSLRDFRRAVYRYHRLGLDRFLEQPAEARQAVLEALRLIQSNRGNTTRDLLFDQFFNAKYREIASLFEDAPPGPRGEAYRLLSEVDPGHLSTYERLRN